MKKAVEEKKENEEGVVVEVVDMVGVAQVEEEKIEEEKGKRCWKVCDRERFRWNHDINNEVNPSKHLYYIISQVSYGGGHETRRIMQQS